MVPSRESEGVWRGPLLVAGAAGLWGSLGLVFKYLMSTYPLSPQNIGFFRAFVGFVVMLFLLGVRRRDLLRVSWRDFPFFAAYGFVAITIFFIVYPAAVQATTVSVAAVLLYTAPAFVTVLAWRLFGEALTAHKIAALLLTFLGCVLVARAYDPNALRLNGWGIFLGLASGFTYGTYSIFGKVGLRRYNSWTVMTYALGFGAIFLLPLQPLGKLSQLLRSSWEAGILVLTMGIVHTAGAFGLYTAGLSLIPASAASIIATLEPVVAAVLSFWLLGERLSPAQLIGGGAIIAGVVILQMEPAAMEAAHQPK